MAGCVPAQKMRVFPTTVSVTMSPAYRPDIDGLRAIAVLLVTGFHAFPNAVTGGFVGVDVFFVISGYLITSIIAISIGRGDFSFGHFYTRRINRIFPALFAVLAACAVGGWFLLFPTDYRDAGKAIGFGAAFLANIALLHDAGYFETASELNPLLHLWSLGVEEQFYLVWPPLLLLAWRRTRGPIALALVVLLASFAANIALTGYHALAAFYLPVTRFWELMGGCVLAIALSSDNSNAAQLLGRHQATLRAGCVWLGLALLGAGAAMIDATRAFPGWWAVLPVAGAALLILGGPTPWPSRKLLGNRAMVYVGLISYPLYLWHWPLLAAIRIVRLGEEPPPLMKAIAILVAFILADLTYRFVERPFRARPKRAKTALAFAAVTVAGLAGAGIYVGDGFPARFDPAVQIVTRDLKSAAETAYRSGSCFLTSSAQFASECVDAAPSGAPLVLLWGDSHAAHLYPGLRELQQAGESGFRIAQYTAPGCPPIFGYPSRQTPECPSINDKVRERLKRLAPDTVVVAARQWSDYGGPDPDPGAVEAMISATIAELRATGVRRIVVIGRLPSWQTPPRRILAAAYRARAAGLITAAEIPARDTPHLESDFAADNARLQALFEKEGAQFVSPTPTFCDGDGCLLAVPGNGTPVVFDGAHLTVEASVYFVQAHARDIIGR